ncbi:hypothetical protein MMC22_004420 [Lobaria immixta]|nr:hypothetical protein [Lobaria immixta]
MSDPQANNGGLGAALVFAFHEAGLPVYATARNPAQMERFTFLGIETVTLDVKSESSITACVSKLSSLDILVNNAGAMFLMPVVDLSIPEAKKMLDLNVWSYIAGTQAFLCLLLKSTKGMIVNQTSAAGCTTIPFQAVYNASKAAIMMSSDTLRLELQPFGITVVDLMTAVVQTNLVRNMREEKKPSLPKGSIYEPAKEVVEKAPQQEQFDDAGIPAQKWPKIVVHDFWKKNPPSVI